MLAEVRAMGAHRGQRGTCPRILERLEPQSVEGAGGPSPHFSFQPPHHLSPQMQAQSWEVCG